MSLAGTAEHAPTDPRTTTGDARSTAPGYLGPGTIVDGKYTIERVLGEGGMGIVYLARDIHTETRVVIKAIRSEFAHNAEFRARMLAEGRALARIDHPNVVRLNAIAVERGALSRHAVHRGRIARSHGRTQPTSAAPSLSWTRSASSA